MKKRSILFIIIFLSFVSMSIGRPKDNCDVMKSQLEELVRHMNSTLNKGSQPFSASDAKFLTSIVGDKNGMVAAYKISYSQLSDTARTSVFQNVGDFKELKITVENYGRQLLFRYYNGITRCMFHIEPIKNEFRLFPREYEEELTGIDPGIAGDPASKNSSEKSLAEETAKVDAVYQFVEQMPTSPYDMQEYFKKNMRYPTEAKAAGVSGRVIVKFVVIEDGSISQPMVVRGIGNGCDDEVIRLVTNMPKWNPGKQGGKEVKVSISIPVVFSLPEGHK